MSIDCLIYKYTRDCYMPHHRTLYARALDGNPFLWKATLLAITATAIVVAIWVIKKKKIGFDIFKKKDCGRTCSLQHGLESGQRSLDGCIC